MVTLKGEKEPRVCNWLLGKRIYLQFSGAAGEQGTKMGGYVIAVDDLVMVLQEEDRIYFVPWTSVRWAHPMIMSAEEREELVSWARD